MSLRELKVLRVASIATVLWAGLWLCGISLWLLNGGRVSYTGYHADGGIWIACGSVFDTPGWQLTVLTRYFAPPVAIILVAVGLLRYCKLKSA